MWYSIFKFEIAYRIKRPETYAFFLFLLLYSVVGVDFIFQGTDFGNMNKNAPLVVGKTMGAITGIFMILSSMIMGVPVLRDFRYQMESLVFVNPIKKRDYLLGKFLGSFVVLLFIFSGILFGMILGEFMPWQNPNEYGDFSMLPYLRSFITITLPTLFFSACLFFITGALSKKLVVVYTQGIFLFVIFMLTKAITNDFWQAILDPFSLTTLTFVTDAWSVVQKNNQLIPFNGALFLNKLFWSILGALILVFGYTKFNFNVVRTKRSKSKSQLQKTTLQTDKSGIAIPVFKIKHGFESTCIQLKEFSWFYFKSICKLPSFWAIVICGMIIILINSVNLGTVYGVDSYPMTYFIVEELQETSIYFFIILLLFYSGELMWKERTAKLDLMYDATPVSNFIKLLGKYVGLIAIYIVMMLALIISGILFQTLSGYYNYQLSVYLFGFFFEILPFLALFTMVSFFIHALSNHKFIGIILVLIFFIVVNVLGMYGFDHDLLLFGGDPLPRYSEMNGYGHYLKPFLWIKAYWLLFGFMLLIIASLFVVRGTETRFVKRCRQIKKRASTSLIQLSGVVLLAFLIVGSYIFYNTNILNEYWSTSKAAEFRVAYETNLKKFEYLPQPKLVDVHLNIELYPSERNYMAEGYYILKNTTKLPISEIHIQKLIESDIDLAYVDFEGGATLQNTYAEFDYRMYKLNHALEPGDSIQMNFKQTFSSKGFTEAISNENIIENGTFFSNKDLPRIGYNRKYEINDADERKTHNLPERLRKATREDQKELSNARSGSHSDGINFEIVLGTEKDQTAIAPGSLLRQWELNERNYFQYKMDVSIIDFYSIVSARYQVKKDTWRPKNDSLDSAVDLEIYYHQEHDYNLDRMMASMKASFDYYTNHFSPYQYNEIRIMEFPRYAQFAQSFPGTVPFSESIGFVLDINDEEDVDMVFFITAHELAHQWFGMQVEAANVQGRHFILETLSQYAALMVFKEYYSEEQVDQFLELQRTKYREDQLKHGRDEPSLALVEDQDYVYYAKGVIQMDRLQKAIGEDNVNLALKRFIVDWNTKDGLKKLKTTDYATTKDLLSYFRAVAPLDQQQLITELFEEVNELDE